MGNISFKPKGFTTGASYYAELLLDSVIVHTEYNLVEFNDYDITVNTPGTYTLRIARIDNDQCIKTAIIQALFPIVTTEISEVDCLTNTYSVFLNLTNPATAGVNVQYGWSLNNDCKTVVNWSVDPNLILPADDVNRYIFVRNGNVDCCNFVIRTADSPCDVCNLDVTNIVFSCS